MNWLAVYRSERASVALRQPVLSQDDVVACESAVALLQHLEARERLQEAAHEQALNAAREQGFEQGRAEAMQQVQDRLLGQWSQLAEDARLDAARMREALIALSTQIVRRVAGALAPEDLLLGLARQAVSELGLGDGPSSLVLRVHPDWAARLRERLATQDWLATAGQIEVRGDPACAHLDLVIDTPLGQILAGLNAQLSSVEQNLKGALAA